MANRTWRLDLEGVRAFDEIQNAIGRGAGLALRIHHEDGGTRVYFTAADDGLEAISQAFGGRARPREIKPDEVTRFG